jgi:hypothetical protein
MPDPPKRPDIQPGDTILMQVVKMSLGGDGKTYVTLSNPDVFVNNATVMLKR